MKKSADFRSIARDTLTGKWKNAVLVGLVASLLGAVGGNGWDVNIDIEAGNAKASLELAGQTIFTTGGDLNSGIGAFLAGGTIYFVTAAIVSSSPRLISLTPWVALPITLNFSTS